MHIQTMVHTVHVHSSSDSHTSSSAVYASTAQMGSGASVLRRLDSRWSNACTKEDVAGLLSAVFHYASRSSNPRKNLTAFEVDQSLGSDKAHADHPSRWTPGSAP